MATENLIIRVDERGARTVSRNIEGIGSGARRAGGGVQLLTRALGALASAGLVRALVGIGDEFRNIQNRLKLVTTGTANLNEVTDKLLAISQRTRSSLSANAELFNRVTLATRELGIEQEQVLNFTESLNQAIKISGASAVEASQGILQLSQGLASGALRGDELRSVLEQLPAVADIIAKQLGVTRGELRELGKEGAITAEVVLEGFKNAREEIAERFQQTVGTVADEFVKLRNQVTVTLGRFLEFSGVTDGIAGGINQITNAVADLTPAFLQLGRVLGGVLQQEDELSRTTQRLAIGLVVVTRTVDLLATALTTTLTTAFTSVGDVIGGIADGLGALAEGDFSRAGELFAEGFDRAGDTIVQNATDLNGELRTIFADTFDDINQILDPTARRAIAEDVGGAPAAGEPRTPIDKEAADALEKLVKSQQKYLDGLAEEQAALQLQAETGLEYAQALEEIQIRQLEAQGGLETFGQDARVARDEIRQLNEELQRQANVAENQDLVLALGDELELLKLTNRERAITLELRKLNVDATADEIAATRELAGQVFDETERLKVQALTLEQIIKDTATATRGLIADALTDGFDNIGTKFADLLLDIAAQALSSEIFKLLSGIGGGAAGGGILGQVGNFFAQGLTGFQNGGNFTVGGNPGVDNNVVAFRASRGETVDVRPQGQQQASTVVNTAPPIVNIVNVTDPEEAAAAIGTSQGQEAILNVITRNRDQIRNALA